MIELIINQQTVCLPNDFSFNVDFDNEFFSKSSGYSLDIDIPIINCPQNVAIFGPINRLDVTKKEFNFSAELRSNNQVLLYGKAVLLAVQAEFITIQLLADTSQFNYDANDVYIDELDLGLAKFKATTDKPSFTNVWTIPSEEYERCFGSVDNTDLVFHYAYSVDPDKIVDGDFYAMRVPVSPFLSTDEIFFKSNLVGYLSCQPYLLRVIERIFKALGYTIGRNDIDKSWLRNLYICNYDAGKVFDMKECFWDEEETIKAYGLKMASALPHWLLSTFISEVEKLCACVFIFNSRTKTVDIVSLVNFFDSDSDIVVVGHENILDDYKIDVVKENTDNIAVSSNISFEGEYKNKWLKIDKEVIDTIKYIRKYPTFEELQAGFNSLNDTLRKQSIFINESNGREYISNYTSTDTRIMLEVNQYSDLIRDPNNTQSVSLKIRPANVKLFNVGWFFDNYNKANGTIRLNVPYGDSLQTENVDVQYAKDIILKGAKVEKNEEPTIEVMLSTGDYYYMFTYQNHQYSYPAAFTDFDMDGTIKGKTQQMSLSLKDVCTQSLGHLYRTIPNFSGKTLYNIRFISKSIPDARSRYIIDNKFYVCRKISVQLVQDMQSYIIEGEFYPMLST